MQKQNINQIVYFEKLKRKPNNIALRKNNSLPWFVDFFLSKSPHGKALSYPCYSYNDFKDAGFNAIPWFYLAH